jgi:Fe2+ or Zn2+ uptake regulation protein
MTTKNKILTDALIEAGHRLTPARRAILETLVDSGGHITADDLVDRVHKAYPQVGRMTVYRTLDLLTELGLARPIFQGPGALHYILMADGDHHHLICSRCNTVIEFDECGSGDLAGILGTKFGFSVTGHLFEIHGICRECGS